MEGVDVDFDLGVDQDDSGRSSGQRTRIVLYSDNMLCHKLMTTKGLQPKLLRWYLWLKQYNFVVRDKNDAHALTDP